MSEYLATLLRSIDADVSYCVGHSAAR